LTGAPKGKIALVTFWGSHEVSPADVARITQVREPQPMQRIELHDGTRLVGLVRRDEVNWSTVRFGDRPCSVARLSDYFAPPPAGKAIAADAELAVPYCELPGECRLVGDLADPILKLRVRGETVELKRTSVVRVEPAADGPAGQVTVVLTGDAELSGRLVGERLRLSTLVGEQSLAVTQIVAFHRPPAAESEADGDGDTASNESGTPDASSSPAPTSGPAPPSIGPTPTSAPAFPPSSPLGRNPFGS
jgi:hypothetical protein